MSTYYSDPKVTRLEQEEWEANVRGKIEQIRVDLPRAGYRQLLPHLKRAGIKIGERKLRKVNRIWLNCTMLLNFTEKVQFIYKNRKVQNC